MTKFMNLPSLVLARIGSLKEYEHQVPVLLSFLLLTATSWGQGQYALSTNADGSIYAYSTNGDGSVSIEGYSGPPWAVTIPTNISGRTVTSIGAGAFTGPFFSADVSLTTVTIPGTVTNIGDYAFYNCSGLTEVTLSYGLIEIGDEVFSDDNALSRITIPDSVINIGDGAFENCAGLANVFFQGNAPAALVGDDSDDGTNVFYAPATCYY